MMAENNVTSTVQCTAQLEEQNSISLQSPEASKDDCRRKYMEVLLEGRRIVDINYFLQQMQRLNQHCTKFGCTINNVFPYKESFSGLQSTIHFHCRMCNENFEIFTNINKTSSMNVTTGVVAAGIAIGIGFSNTEELFMILDIPFMSTKTYVKYAEKVNKAWIATATSQMQKAAKQEADYAIDIERVDENGIPLLTVIADGCWSKRSYRSNYSALSGAAAVIGQQYGKVLYLGVKNKYCTICARTGDEQRESQKHICYKNYEGSSSSMEAAILVEAFKKSEEMYGVKYNKLIADGDSSTYKRILESRPYKNVTVEKIECRNHILRNYCNKLRALSQDTRYPLKLRRLISSNVMRLRTAVVSAIKFRKTQADNYTKSELVELLKNDIQNSVCHVFGHHKNCDNYFCKKQAETEDYLPEIQNCIELYIRLQEYVKCVWINARSLISDVDSNVVEQFNSTIAKHVGGKRVNFSLKGSYEARCTASVVRFNTRQPLTELHKTICGTDAPKRLIEFELQRNRKIKNHHQKLRPNNPRRYNKGKREPKTVDLDYGEKCQQTDLPEDIYVAEKNKFLKALRQTKEEVDTLQNATIAQADSGKWLEERRKRLTASMFYKVCTRRPTTLCKDLVVELLYKAKSLNIFSLRHGRENESRAKVQLERQENIIIKPCGLFIDIEHCYLGASPDGVINDDLIVEIKCPSSAYNMCPDDAIKQKKIKFWRFNEITSTFEVNIKNTWYYQIQGQLRVTGRKGCLFAVWTGEQFPLKIAYIRKCNSFWKNNMQPKLQKFYMDCLLPELVDPRYCRNMDIREPPYIVEARKKI